MARSCEPPVDVVEEVPDRSSRVRSASAARFRTVVLELGAIWPRGVMTGWAAVAQLGSAKESPVPGEITHPG